LTLEEQEILSYGAITDQFKAWINGTIYKDIVSTLAFSDKPIVAIDYNDILAFNPYDLPKHFETDVDNAIDCLKSAISEKMLETDVMHENTNNPNGIQVRIQNYDTPIPLREIQTLHNKKMIVINCVIAKASEPKPFMIKSVYLCSECGHHEASTKNTYIKKCPSCEAESKMVLDTEKSIFTSACHMTIQDLPEDLPAGQIPVSKHVLVLGEDLTHPDKCRPGSRIKLTAIVRLGYDKTTLDDIKANADPLGILQTSSTGTTFSLDLTANNIESLGDSESSQGRKHALSKSDIERIQSYKNHPMLSEILVNSFAPHIFGHDSIKECLLLALVSMSIYSSPTQDVPAFKKRGDINILLVGNAGVAKSQMLIFASKVSPRCIYVSGRGSSGVGLTAAVTKDEKTGTMMLEAGAAVLADKGVLIVDEFDKLKAEDRSALHEVTEQQTCSIAKGGIVATLNARVSLLAAANPLTGTYDSYKTLAENTGYPPSLISRFDFIFVIKDIIDEQNDTDIANLMLLGQQYEERVTQNQAFDISFLSKYLQYTKALPEPRLTSEAARIIASHYVSLRQQSEKDQDGTVSALTVTARLVESLKRAAVARAKLLQKDEVDKEDVHRVIKLISDMYSSFGIIIPDANSPNLAENVKKVETINLGLLYGKPASKLNKKRVFFELCDSMTNNGKMSDIDITILSDELVKSRKFVTEYDAKDFIGSMIREGILSQRKGNVYRYNRDSITQV
jgi:replicative DNA helicase Mcm